MDLRECYAELGANYDNVMRRLMNEERAARFLKMFLDDKSFTELGDGLAAGDYEGAFRAAHTLKGICMNLDLTRLGELSAALTENLRACSADSQTAALFDRARAEYLRTTEILRRNLDQSTGI